MTADQWQAQVTREAARAIGTWLEGRGRLQQPIAALTMAELEAMASNAISRFVVLGMERVRTKADNAEALTRRPRFAEGRYRSSATSVLTTRPIPRPTNCDQIW